MTMLGCSSSAPSRSLSLRLPAPPSPIASFQSPAHHTSPPPSPAPSAFIFPAAHGCAARTCSSIRVLTRHELSPVAAPTIVLSSTDVGRPFHYLMFVDWVTVWGVLNTMPSSHPHAHTDFFKFRGAERNCVSPLWMYSTFHFFPFAPWGSGSVAEWLRDQLEAEVRARLARSPQPAWSSCEPTRLMPQRAPRPKCTTPYGHYTLRTPRPTPSAASRPHTTCLASALPRRPPMPRQPVCSVVPPPPPCCAAVHSRICWPRPTCPPCGSKMWASGCSSGGCR